jgi:D-alanyl-lipoteichoic acid acyltransferase DltB (MBOAT superfamily)
MYFGSLTFNSYEFIFVFLPVVLCGYWLLRPTRLVNYWLAAASLVFYATSGLIYLLPLLFTCIFDYFVGARIYGLKQGRRRTYLFVSSVAIQIAILSACKYLGWITSNANAFMSWMGLATVLPVVALILPPGISFYTFHTISYTADIYRGKFSPHNKLIDYITFVAFFPQLVAGPIARASDLLPQIAARRPSITWAQAEIAVWLICWGLFKKIALADNFGHLVELIQPRLQPNTVSAGVGLLFAYAFAGQIYCDFSAYTDIARGVAKLFNIELTRNFRTPYFAASPSDFWRRWHISLSTWLRDYLYIPLGGDRHGRLATLRNLTITMFLGGLWHGAGIGFIIWGLYHGLLLVIYRVCRIDDFLAAPLRSRTIKAIAMFVMFQLVCLGWIFFRATPAELLPAFSSLVGYSAPPDWNFLKLIAWGLAIYSVPLAVTEYLGYRRNSEFIDLYPNWHWFAKGIAYVSIFYAVVLFGARKQSEFIYFQF